LEYLALRSGWVSAKILKNNHVIIVSIIFIIGYDCL
jgi:hypothetical protein